MAGSYTKNPLYIIYLVTYKTLSIYIVYIYTKLSMVSLF